MADTVRGTIYPNLPGNCAGEGYKLVSKQGFVEPPLSSENLEWVKDEAITDADKDQIYENKHNIESLQEEVSNIETALDDKSEVSGENDGTNWTSLTIDGTTKAIPSGGGGGGFTPTQAQLDAMNSGIDSTKVGQIADNTSDIASLQTEVDNLDTDKQDKLIAGTGITIGSDGKTISASGEIDAYTKSETDTLLNGKVDKVTGKGLSTNDFTNADKTKLDGIDLSTKQDVLNTSQLNAVNSGIDSTKVSQIATNTTDIAGKQAQLSTAQLNACNSGIDSTKVAQIATNTTNIGNKVDKETGKGLSTNDYTTAEKNKVALINSTETLTFTLSGGTTVNLKVVTGV